MKILRKSKTRHIYLVQKVLLQGELSYYRTKRRSRPLFSPDLSFRLKGENLKGLAIVAFIY